jgi:organic radical activating enzyme
MNDRSIHVEIEATNLCNTRCLHCPHEMISRSSGRMEWNTYQSVLDKVMAYTPNFSVEYAGMGEPLLNPSIYDFIRYVSSKGSTTLTTNASALTPQNTRRLIDVGLAGLTISFNGDNPQLYELMMGNLSFQRAQENLRAAVEFSQGTHTEVAANVSVTRQTQTRLASIKQTLNNAGVTKIFFSKCHSRGGFLKGDAVCNTPKPPTDMDRCDIFTYTLFVAWTGEVLSCCQDLAGANVIGDLKTDPLDAILEKKQRIAADGVRFEICGHCNDMYRFMCDQTFDGRSIADWVYDLYAGDNKVTGSEISPLSEWIFSLYAQEGQAQRICSALIAGNRQLLLQKSQAQQAFASLASENQELKNANQSLAGQIEEIRSTRTWRLLDRLNRFRKRVFPR